jgi:Uncharacterized protein conserved in bacteria (DUF2255)
LAWWAPAAGVEKDVTFVVDADPTVNDRIDASYRSKYRRYGATIIGIVVNPNGQPTDRRTADDRRHRR